jgi:hypothetical protein
MTLTGFCYDLAKQKAQRTFIRWAFFALSSATAPMLFESPLATLYKLPDKTETPVSLQHWSSWWSEAT